MGNKPIFDTMRKFLRYVTVDDLDNWPLDQQLHLNGKAYIPDDVLDDEARDLCIYFLLRAVFFPEKPINLGFFTQALWSITDATPEWIVKVFVVAMLGLDQLQQPLEHVLMTIIEAASCMAKMIPGCNISFHMLHVFAQYNPRPERLELDLNFALGEKWIPPNLSHLQHLSSVYDDDFLVKYQLESYEPFAKLENKDVRFAEITKNFRLIHPKPVKSKPSQIVIEILVVQDTDFTEDELFEVLEHLDDMLSGKNIYVAVNKTKSETEPWNQLDAKFKIPIRVKHDRPGELLQLARDKFRRKIRINQTKVLIENVLTIAKQTNFQERALSFDDLNKILEN